MSDVEELSRAFFFCIETWTTKEGKHLVKVSSPITIFVWSINSEGIVTVKVRERCGLYIIKVAYLIQKYSYNFEV